MFPIQPHVTRIATPPGQNLIKPRHNDHLTGLHPNCAWHFTCNNLEIVMDPDPYLL